MPLQPSRRDTIGPPPRDVSNLAALVRHQGSYLKQLDPGLQGGRFATPRPVSSGASQLVGGGDGGDATDDEEISFWNTDAATATTAGTVTLNLTYEPIDGSLHIRWNGLDQPPNEWTLDGQTVTFTESHIQVGDVLTAAYAHYPLEDDPVTYGPATATLRGTTATSGASGNTGITSLALPAGTLIGDLIVISYESNATANLTVADPRLVFVGNSMWIGFATGLSDVAVTATGGFASNWSIACMTLATNAVGWTAAVTTSDLSMVAGDTLDVGAVAGVGAAVCAIHDGHSVSSGTTSEPAGYTIGISSASALSHARVDYWAPGVLGTSPTGPATFAGGAGGAVSTVVGLIGPEVAV